MKVLLVAGGSSSEREISLRSAAAVKSALEEKHHHVELFDFNDGIDTLTAHIHSCDVVFPVMHGKEGEDGSLYASLRASGKPFVGSDPEGAHTAFDKVLFKRYAEAHGIRTAEWKTIQRKSDIALFGYPCVLKAASGGSSHEVALLHSEADLSNPKVAQIFALNDEMYVERLLTGVEITVGVLLDAALPVIEIVPPEGGWFDYENKYSGESREIPFAPSVPASIQENAQRISLDVHQDLKLGSYSRSDFIVESGELYILEVNTPGGVGLTTGSLFPKAAQAADLTFPALMEQVITHARVW